MHGQPAPSLDSAPHSDAWGEAAPPSRRRIDIQALRGVAVLMVVAYHAMPDWVKGGFLGVDVFFVISGFLITGHILQDLEHKRFGLGGFYVRRARRLLPAAWTTFLVTTLLAYPLLTSAQWRDYLAQLIGALTFTANFVLAHQSGYFEAAADAKPLLHIWSLSLEEQFYFVAPLILLVLGRRLRGPALVIGAVLSLALCVTLASGWLPVITSKAAGKIAFYMLPARAWELLAGALAAWLALKRPAFCPPTWLRWAALATILMLAVVSLDPIHPRLDAIIAVAATTVLMPGGDGWLRKVVALRPIAAVGDWSYSIYLVHWPLLAFAHAAWLGEPPVLLTIALAAVAIPLGFAQYRWVEQPFQKGLVRTPRRAAVWLGLAAAGFVAACAPAAWASYSTGKAGTLTPNQGLSPACDTRGARWIGRASCRTSANPSIALWGDSYAMHLAPGLRAIAGGRGLVQMTKSACAPVPGIAQLSASYSMQWARECIGFNDSVLQAIERSPSISLVVISSPFDQVFNPSGTLAVDGHEAAWSAAAAERLAASVRRLQAAGKTVVIVGPTPRAPFDAGACNLRLRQRLWTPGRRDCAIDQDASRQADKWVIAGLTRVGRETGASVLWPQDVLCRAGRCMTAEDGVLLYHDNGHLTVEGSRFVVSRLGLAGRLKPGP